MRPTDHREYLEFAPDQPPVLVVVVDTEEEFAWDHPFSRASTSVESIADLGRAQRIFERFGVKPTYVADYPVASQPNGYGSLREWAADGLCDVGAHLQPWVNPPHDEEVSDRTSFPCNLPPVLQRRKLERLTEAIRENVGVEPKVYKAGRYGIGENLEELLTACDYEVDASAFPYFDFSPIHGTDFREFDARPFRFGSRGQFTEVPMTAGYIGLLRRLGPSVNEPIVSDSGRTFHIPGILSRMRVLERVALSPESWDVNDHRMLTNALLADGHRVFSYTFHSPSLTPGFTPYVRNRAELDRFLGHIEGYLEDFFGRLGGVTVMARDLAAYASERQAATAAA